MKNKFKKFFILFLFFSFFYSLNYYFIILEKTKHLREILYFTEQMFSSEIQSGLNNLNFLASDSNLKDAILKNDIQKVELLFDDYSISYSNFELIMLSDKEGRIIASNTKNSKIKSFNNSEFKSLTIKGSTWYNGSKMPSKVNDINNSDSFYINKVSKTNIDSKYIEFVVSVYDISGTRIAAITAYYNFNFLSDTLQRFNITIFDADKKILTDTSISSSKNFFIIKENRSFYLSDKEFLLTVGASISIFNFESFIISIFFIFILLLFYFFYKRTPKIFKNRILEHELKLLGISFKKLNTNDGQIFKINTRDYFIKNSLIDIISKDLLLKLESIVDELNNSNEKVKFFNLRNIELERINDNLKKDNIKFINLNDKLSNIKKIIQKNKFIKKDFESKKEVNIEGLDAVPIIKYKNEILSELETINCDLFKLNEFIYNQYLSKTIESERLLDLFKAKIKKLSSSMVFLRNFLNEININSVENIFNEYSKTNLENINLKQELNTIEIYKSEVLNFKNAIDQISELLASKEEPGA